MLKSLPNLLTLSRILVIPLIIATFYLPDGKIRWVACALFVAAAITDFFDGYLATASHRSDAFLTRSPTSCWSRRCC
jgi:cardiolipin synthase